MLGLPMVSLRRHGYVHASAHDVEWERTPRTVGVGSDGDAITVWPSRLAPGRLRVTGDDGSAERDGITLDGALDPSFVQPLPGGRTLLVNGRTRDEQPNAEIWSADGELLRRGYAGDAVEDVLTTEAGDVWVGYFDEGALSGSALSRHGLVRLSGELEPVWLYPTGGELPPIWDCYVLNVGGERATILAYSAWHLVTVEGDAATDLGEVPHAGAHRLLVDGDRAVLVGGYGPEYDLVTPLRVTGAGVEPAGPQRRLVQPDGMELPRSRSQCRGPDLHLFDSTQWFRADLDQLFGG